MRLQDAEYFIRKRCQLFGERLQFGEGRLCAVSVLTMPR